MWRSKIYILVALVIMLSSCRTVHAPLNKLEKTPEAFVKSGKGGWMTLRLKAPHIDAGKTKGGEFLWQDESSIYLLNDTITAYPKQVIDLAVLELMEKRPYAWWWILGSVSTASHGFVLIFSFPLWHIVGIPSTVGELWHDVYRQEKPDEKYWQGINVLARFPGGLDENEKVKISK
ncbi:MAG: hypothetical protein IT279_01760 [Ignavibacteriaceae bacterium]|nr:hypothetical protein [Ignavibacteriaceae bacterium]